MYFLSSSSNAAIVINIFFFSTMENILLLRCKGFELEKKLFMKCEVKICTWRLASSRRRCRLL